MSTHQHVFWLTPEGRGSREDKYAPTCLLSELGKITGLNAQGNFTWPPNIHETFTPIECSIIIFDTNNEELNDIETVEIVRNGIRALLKANGVGEPIHGKHLLTECDKFAAEHFRVAETKYVLVTSISVESFPCKSLAINGCKIKPLKPRNKFKMPPLLEDDPRIRKRYLPITIETTGRTGHSAVIRAVEALNLLLGIWNFSISYGGWKLTGGQLQSKAISDIQVGGIQTLHLPHGESVEDGYWHDPSFTKEVDLYKPQDGWKKVESDRRWLMSKIRRLEYRAELEKLFGRYNVALSHSDLNVAFLKLWSILEKLTDTIGKNYEQTIKKATFIYAIREIEGETLNCLRVRRNRYVHSASAGREHDQMLYLLKRYVDHHLIYLVRNDFAVSSLEGYAKFLSRPRALPELETEFKQIKHAINTIKKWDAQLVELQKKRVGAAAEVSPLPSR